MLSGMELRVCYPLVKYFYEYEPESGFYGIFGALGNLYLEVLSHLNVSQVMESQLQIGDRVPGNELRYTGCLGKLQANESDITIIGVELPVPGPGLVQGPVIGSDIMMIGSTYNMNVNSSSTDVMECFNAFPPDLWVLIAFCYVFLFFLTAFIMWADVMFSKSRNMMRREGAIAIYGTMVFCSEPIEADWKIVFGDSLKLMASSLLDHYASSANITCSSWPFQIIQLFIVTLGFYVTFYFGGMIKTDMVVQKRPITIETYEQFLEREDVHPLYNGATRDSWIFADADPSSIEGKIWSRAVKFGAAKSLLIPRLDTVKYFSECVVQQTCVLFTSTRYAPIVFSNFCSLTRSQGVFTDNNVLFKVDEHAKEKLSGLMLSSFISPSLKSGVHYYFRRALDHDLLSHAFQLSYFTLSPNTGSKSIADCFANTVVTKDDHAIITSPDFHHFVTLFKVQLCYWTVATVILVSEFLMSWTGKRRKRENLVTHVVGRWRSRRSSLRRYGFGFRS